MTTEDRMKEIEDRAGKASEKCSFPWNDKSNWVPTVWDDFGDSIVNEMDACFYFEPEVAAFIAHSTTDIPWLIAQLKSTRKALDRKDYLLSECIEALKDSARKCDCDNTSECNFCQMIKETINLAAAELEKETDETHK